MQVSKLDLTFIAILSSTSLTYPLVPTRKYIKIGEIVHAGSHFDRAHIGPVVLDIVETLRT